MREGIDRTHPHTDWKTTVSSGWLAPYVCTTYNCMNMYVRIYEVLAHSLKCSAPWIFCKFFTTHSRAGGTILSQPPRPTHLLVQQQWSSANNPLLQLQCG